MNVYDVFTDKYIDKLDIDPTAPPERYKEITGKWINREKAIEDLQNGDPSQLYDVEDIKYWLNCLPSAQPEPHWIPCSERLPELDDEVLVTDDRGELRHCIFCTWGETWCGFITYEEGMRIKAAAWMPMPEAYRNEQE